MTGIFDGVCVYTVYCIVCSVDGDGSQHTGTLFCNGFALVCGGHAEAPFQPLRMWGPSRAEREKNKSWCETLKQLGA